MPSPILARADALMQRRRQHAEVDDVPVLTDAIHLDITLPPLEDDVPVLLDIDPLAAPDNPPQTFAADAAAAAPEAAAPLVEAASSAVAMETPAECPAAPSTAVTSEDLAQIIARQVEQRLAAALPGLIEAAVRDALAGRQDDNPG